MYLIGYGSQGGVRGGFGGWEGIYNEKQLMGKDFGVGKDFPWETAGWECFLAVKDFQ